MSDGGGAKPHSELWKALQKLTDGLGVQRDDLKEVLAGKLALLRDCWSINLRADISVVRRAVTLNLAEHIQRLEPTDRGPRSELSSDQHARNYRRVVIVNFNLVGKQDEAGLAKMVLMARRGWLASTGRESFRVSTSTSQRYLEHAIDQIEDQIREGYEPIESASESDDRLEQDFAEIFATTTVNPADQVTSLDGMRISNQVEDSTNHADDAPAVPVSRRVRQGVRWLWRDRKGLVVVSGVVVAVAISLVVWLAPGGQGSSNKAIDTPTSTPAVSSPYLTTTATADFGGDGYSVVFADKNAALPFVAQNRSGSAGGVGNGITDVFDRELSAGAYAAGSEELNVSLKNKSTSELEITNIELVNFKHDPIPLGAMFENPGEQNEAGSVGFVLDQTGAVPLTYDSGTGTFGSSYFRAKPSIAVPPDGLTSLQINFLAQAGAYSFSIVLDYTVNGTHEHAYVTGQDGNKPLVVRVSATLCSKLPASVPAAEQQQFEQDQYQGAYHVIDDMNAGLELVATDPKQFVANGCE
jgi:hypothetical protein